MKQTPLLGIDLMNRYGGGARRPQYESKQDNRKEKPVDDGQLEMLFKMFKAQGLDNAHSLARFLELFRKSKLDGKSLESLEDTQNDLSRSYSSLFKKKQHVNKTPEQLPKDEPQRKIQEWSSSTKPQYQQLTEKKRINVVKCSKDQFVKTNSRSIHGSENRYSHEQESRSTHGQENKSFQAQEIRSQQGQENRSPLRYDNRSFNGSEKRSLHGLQNRSPLQGKQNRSHHKQEKIPSHGYDIRSFNEQDNSSYHQQENKSHIGRDHRSHQEYENRSSHGQENRSLYGQENRSYHESENRSIHGKQQRSPRGQENRSYQESENRSIHGKENRSPHAQDNRSQYDQEIRSHQGQENRSSHRQENRFLNGQENRSYHDSESRSFHGTEKEDSHMQSRLTKMIHNAKQGLDILEDKFNTFSSNQNELSMDTAADKKSTQSFNLSSMIEKSLLLPCESQSEYLYEGAITDYKGIIAKSSQDRECLMQKIQVMEQQNKCRDTQLSSLNEDMQRVQLVLSQLNTKKRQKKLQQRIGELSHSPRSQRKTPRQVSVNQKKPEVNVNAYTFNLSSPQQSKKSEGDRSCNETSGMTQERKKAQATATDLRDYIIHTQSQQILKHFNKQ